MPFILSRCTTFRLWCATFELMMRNLSISPLPFLQIFTFLPKIIQKLIKFKTQGSNSKLLRVSFESLIHLNRLIQLHKDGKFEVSSTCHIYIYIYIVILFEF